MPYKDPEVRSRTHRNSLRAARHGQDWRAVVWEYGNACANIGRIAFPDCWETEALEFHEPFGEIKLKPIAMLQSRMLLCKSCHLVVHNGRFPLERGLESMVHQDIEDEMVFDGGYFAWLYRRHVGFSLPGFLKPEFILERYTEWLVKHEG